MKEGQPMSANTLAVIAIAALVLAVVCLVLITA